MNIERCRACLETHAAEYIDMETILPCSKMSYIEFFNQCTQLNAQLRDDLPRVLCNSCANDMIAADVFVSTACQANAMLQEELAATLLQMDNNMETVSLSNENMVQLIDSGDESSEFVMECVLIEDNDIQLGDVLIAETPVETMYNVENHSVSTTGNTFLTVTEFLTDDELDDKYMIEYNEQDEQLAKQEGVVSKWRCSECKLVLRGDVSYVGHMNMHRGKRPYACDECRCAFRCKTAFARHKTLRHAKPNENLPADVAAQAVYKCQQCLKEFDSKIALNEHCLLLHDTSDNCNCPYCPKITKLQRTDIVKHLKQQHPEQYSLHFPETAKSTEKLVQCLLCHKQLQNQKNLQKHMLLHKHKTQQNEKIFLCSYCPRKLKNQKSLTQHERMHADSATDVIYMCLDCDRQYTTQLLLEQHRKQAHKERDNVCKICGNAFKLKNQLVNHMKLHLEKNIQCPHCDKRYARPFDLNVHMRSHTGELPFACHLCDRRFAIKVRLTYHLQKHYGIKHPCRVCGAEFNSKQKLKGHSYKHTGMPYRCEFCSNRGFSNRDLFKRHLLRVHNATMTDDELVAMFRRNTGKTTRIQEVQSVVDESASSVETQINIKIENLHTINNGDTEEICIT